MGQFDSTVFLKTLTTSPGVYRMYDVQQQVIYVGKAKNLKKRVASYFRQQIKDDKTRALVRHIHQIEVTLTNNETEALILENQLIKKYQPRYNILLRDDKSYPYILLSGHRHPRLSFHRGARREEGEYFGPFPNGAAVSESLRLMQKIFSVRQCEDQYYRSRSRPCLQYQLKRCSAPCVGLIADQAYQEEVDLVRQFLQGKSQQVIASLVEKMEQASMKLAFEVAAKYRDQIGLLRKVQEQQAVTGQIVEMDILGFAERHGLYVIHLLMVRDYKVLGSRTYFPKVPKDANDPQQVLMRFIGQYYLSNRSRHQLAKEIILPFSVDEQMLLEHALCTVSEQKIQLKSLVRAERAQYLALANKNANHSLDVKLQTKTTIAQRYAKLQALLQLTSIRRMECFDISHSLGECPVASCVVFDEQGPNTREYRCFNVEGVTPGDDYAAIAFAVRKRYAKLKDPEKIPDVIFIDGGQGQLASAEQCFQDWSFEKMPLLIGVAKGTERRAGLETLFVDGGRRTVSVANDSPALHLIQHIRDESHRFAITGHRRKRQKQRTQSVLEEIKGVGAKRRQALLKYLGGLQGVTAANIHQLQQVPGISSDMAEKIFNHLHDNA